MPAGDRTGPNGMGAMTGRGTGLCAGFGAPGYMNGGPGAARGRGRGFGRGMGFGRWGAAVPAAAPTREQQIGALNAQTEQLEAQMKAVREQIQTLSSDQGE